jgi:plastocyanin
VKKHLFVSGLLATAAVATTGVSAQAYDVITVANGGSIEGTIVYHGDVPMKKIIPTKDVATCGGPREDPLIRVGADGVVESAVVYLKDVTSGKDWPTAGKTPVLDNKDCRFYPEISVMPAGPLDVLNSDPVLHNTHGYYGKRTAFNLALPNQNQSIPTELPRAGEVRVDCDAHGWMEGWIYVVDNAYYAITGADGKFSITDVPPGDYTLVAVQPFTGPMELKVTVAAGQATTMDIELKKQ